MKKRFLFFALPLVAMLSLGSCGDDEIESENNTPNKEQTDPNKPSGDDEDNYDDEDDYARTCEEKCTTFGKTNGVEYVDLGLPSGNLWAMMNIGADKIEAYGDLYSWGETSTKDNYGEDYYSLYKKDETEVDGFTNYIHGYTKYMPKDKASEYGYGGFFDNKTTLDLTDDVAHVKLGGSWRMPTACDFDELLENCDKVWCTYQGVNGYKFTAKNGKWLFLPAAGCSYDDYRLKGDYGYYWSSSLYSDDLPYYAYGLGFDSGSIYGSNCSRYYGYSVRAVCPSVKTGNGGGSQGGNNSGGNGSGGNGPSGDGGDTPATTMVLELGASPSAGGVVSGGGSYELGKTVTIEAKPSDGYSFVKWNDGVDVNPRTITVTKDMSLFALFEKLKDDKPLGKLCGRFSVSPTKQVSFAMGNLQYQPSTRKWRFAENQYDVIGAENENFTTSSYSGWIDLFGWGSSGYNNTFPFLQCDGSVEDYEIEYNDIAGTNYDWGVYNAISNGGNRAGMWRTLTNDEWAYLYGMRTNAMNLRGRATVNGQAGYILLPDGWRTPISLRFTANPYNFTTNIYSVSEWSRMEAAGALFLPCAGANICGWFVDKVGGYWSTMRVSESDGHAYSFQFDDHNEYPSSTGFGANRFSGYSARLVQE